MIYFQHVIEDFHVVYDAGRMINVGIEVGQIEGALIFGIGWLKLEHQIWDDKGPQEVGTWQYKPPMHLDIPKKFSIYVTNSAPEFENCKNDNYPMSSKAAGESAMCMSLVYRNALQRAIEAYNPNATSVELPAKPDNVLKALNISANALVLE